MYQNRSSRFRRRSNGRNNHSRDNGGMNIRPRSNSFSDNKTRNRFRTPQSAEKLFEKYNTLAKEAMSSGDKTLSENYFQHADHFMRIIENKNINQNQNKTPTDDKENKTPTDDKEKVMANDRHLTENSTINQNKTIKEKEKEENKK